jgi:general stress protein 26
MEARQARLKVYDLLGRFKTTMMVTHAPSGPLDCRPMQIAGSDLECGGPLWFITSVQGEVPHEISEDARTLLVFQGSGHYVAVWGRAEILADEALVRRFWRDAYRAWVPQGPDDPALRLVKFIPHSAEFWMADGGDAVRFLFEAARARVAGDEAGGGEDAHHARVNLAAR